MILKMEISDSALAKLTGVSRQYILKLKKTNRLTSWLTQRLTKQNCNLLEISEKDVGEVDNEVDNKVDKQEEKKGNKEIPPVTPKEINKEREEPKYMSARADFESFRVLYRKVGVVRGADREFEDFKKKHKNDWQEIVPLLIPGLERNLKYRRQLGAVGRFVPEMPAVSVWLNKHRWTTEYPNVITDSSQPQSSTPLQSWDDSGAKERQQHREDKLAEDRERVKKQLSSQPNKYQISFLKALCENTQEMERLGLSDLAKQWLEKYGKHI